MKKIDYIQRYGTGFLAKGISDNDIRADVMLHEIRGVVIPPKDIYPGYYLYMGMVKDANIYMKHPLLFLYEAEYDTFGSLMSNLFDDASRLKASVVYAQLPKSQKVTQGFYRDLWDYRYRNDIPVRIKPAISTEDYRYGDAIIKEWKHEKALLLPVFVDTILNTQLFTDHGMDIESDLKDDQWYAFHALRFLLAGFIKSPPQQVMQGSMTGWGDRYDSENILSTQPNNERSLKGWT